MAERFDIVWDLKGLEALERGFYFKTPALWAFFKQAASESGEAIRETIREGMKKGRWPYPQTRTGRLAGALHKRVLVPPRGGWQVYVGVDLEKAPYARDLIERQGGAGRKLLAPKGPSGRRVFRIRKYEAARGRTAEGEVLRASRTFQRDSFPFIRKGLEDAKPEIRRIIWARLRELWRRWPSYQTKFGVSPELSR